MFDIANVIDHCESDYDKFGTQNGITKPELLLTTIFNEVIRRDLDPYGTKKIDEYYRKMAQGFTEDYLKLLKERDEDEINKNKENYQYPVPLLPITGTPYRYLSFTVLLQT